MGLREELGKAECMNSCMGGIIQTCTGVVSARRCICAYIKSCATNTCIYTCGKFVNEWLRELYMVFKANEIQLLGRDDLTQNTKVTVTTAGRWQRSEAEYYVWHRVIYDVQKGPMERTVPSIIEWWLMHEITRPTKRHMSFLDMWYGRGKWKYLVDPKLSIPRRMLYQSRSDYENAVAEYHCYRETFKEQSLLYILHELSILHRLQETDSVHLQRVNLVAPSDVAWVRRLAAAMCAVKLEALNGNWDAVQLRLQSALSHAILSPLINGCWASCKQIEDIFVLSTTHPKITWRILQKRLSVLAETNEFACNAADFVRRFVFQRNCGQCPICFEIPQGILMPSCGHSICIRCMWFVMKTKPAICPNCRRPYDPAQCAFIYNSGDTSCTKPSSERLHQMTSRIIEHVQIKGDGACILVLTDILDLVDTIKTRIALNVKAVCKVTTATLVSPINKQHVRRPIVYVAHAPLLCGISMETCSSIFVHDTSMPTKQLQKFLTQHMVQCPVVQFMYTGTPETILDSDDYCGSITETIRVHCHAVN